MEVHSFKLANIFRNMVKMAPLNGALVEGTVVADGRDCEVFKEGNLIIICCKTPNGLLEGAAALYC